jgi:hypothetical protein
MPSVVAAIVTHKRPGELRRLLEGLEASDLALTGCVISDHAPDGSTAKLAAARPWPTVVLDDTSNPGPGAGWANAAREALRRFPDLDAIWYLDDDVVIAPTDLGLLWREMERGHADAIAPLLEDADGHLWAFPEPEDRSARQRIREATTTRDARSLLGEEPLPFCWCTGACFLVGRTALESTSLHRTDFWMLGEDLEYSMRIADRNQAVFTCLVSIPHLPPVRKNDLTPAHDQQSASDQSEIKNQKSTENISRSNFGGIFGEPASVGRPGPRGRGPSRTETEADSRGSAPMGIDHSGYLKFCSLLQNLSYLSFHSRESRHMKRYLPGNFLRFFRTHGVVLSTLRDGFHCFWHGALRGQPAGTRAGQVLRQRVSKTAFRR